VGIFDWVEIKWKCVKYAINVIVDVWISWNKVEFWICIRPMVLFEFFPVLSLQNTLQNIDSNSISVYSENNAYLNIYLYMINNTKYASNKKTQFLGYLNVEDFGVLWVWGFCGDSHGIWHGRSGSTGRSPKFESKRGRVSFWTETLQYLWNEAHRNSTKVSMTDVAYALSIRTKINDLGWP